jgi:hypothetical protein
MAKAKRGKTILTTKNWRGTCPKCERTGTKLLWEMTEGEKKMKVCKICDATARNKAG